MRKIGKKLTSLLFVALAFSTVAFSASAGMAGFREGTAIGYTTVKYDGRAEWSFNSTTTRTAPYNMATTKWLAAEGVYGATVTHKLAKISESSPKMTNGYLTCAYGGVTQFSNKMILYQYVDDFGYVRSHVVYGVEVWSN